MTDKTDHTANAGKKGGTHPKPGFGDDVLQKLVAMEALVAEDPGLIPELEALYETLAQAPGRSPAVLLARNAFRVTHAAQMKTRRPRLLIGRNNEGFDLRPATIELMMVADVMVCTAVQERAKNRPEFLYCPPPPQRLDEALKNLPDGFHIDIVLDTNICGGPLALQGFDRLECPVVGGVVHHQAALSNYHLAKLYDVFLPYSKRFTELMRGNDPDACFLDVPFGLTYSSNSIVIGTDTPEKDIDLLISFSPNYTPQHMHYRQKAAALAQAFKDNYPDYRVEFISGLNRADYFKTMKRAVLAVNAVTANGPYNMRTLEIMDCAAFTLQLRTDYATEPQYFDRYFKEGEEFEWVDETTFEQTVLRLLKDRPQTLEKAKAVQQRVAVDMRNDTLYTQVHHQIFGEGGLDLTALYDRRAKAQHHDALWALAMFYHKEQREIVALQKLGEIAAFTGRSIQSLMLAILPAALRSLKTRDAYYKISDVELAAAFQRGLDEGIDLLYQRIDTPDIIDRFNRFAALALLGQRLCEDPKDLIDAIEASPLLISPNHLVVNDFREHREEAALKTAFVHDLNYAFMLAGQDAQKISAAFKTFMVKAIPLLA